MLVRRQLPHGVLQVRILQWLADLQGMQQQRRRRQRQRDHC
jgi:hypothetical protein